MGHIPHIMLSCEGAKEFKRWLNKEGFPFRREHCLLIYEDIHIAIFNKGLLYYDFTHINYDEIRTVYTNPVHVFRILINYGVLGRLYADFPEQMKRFSQKPKIRQLQPAARITQATFPLLAQS